MPIAKAHTDHQKRAAFAELMNERSAKTHVEIALALNRADNVRGGLMRMNAKGPGVFSGTPMQPATKSVPKTKAPAMKKTTVTIAYVGGEPKTAVKR